MKTFLGLFAYAFIGGLLAGYFSNHMKEKCGEHSGTAEFALIVATWPGVFAASLLIDTDADEPTKCPEPRTPGADQHE